MSYPSRVALSVTRRSADRRVAGSSPGRNASRRCTRSATLWAQGIGDWELFSHGISARASMWDMQEASGRYLITGLRVWKPRSKQTNKQTFSKAPQRLFRKMWVGNSFSRHSQIYSQKNSLSDHSQSPLSKFFLNIIFRSSSKMLIEFSILSFSNCLAIHTDLFMPKK